MFIYVYFLIMAFCSETWVYSSWLHYYKVNNILKSRPFFWSKELYLIIYLNHNGILLANFAQVHLRFLKFLVMYVVQKVYSSCSVSHEHHGRWVVKGDGGACLGFQLWEGSGWWQRLWLDCMSEMQWPRNSCNHLTCWMFSWGWWGCPGPFSGAGRDRVTPASYLWVIYLQVLMLGFKRSKRFAYHVFITPLTILASPSSKAAVAPSLVPLLCCPLNLGEQQGSVLGVFSSIGALSIGNLSFVVVNAILYILTTLKFISPGRTSSTCLTAHSIVTTCPKLNSSYSWKPVPLCLPSSVSDSLVLAQHTILGIFFDTSSFLILPQPLNPIHQQILK